MVAVSLYVLVLARMYHTDMETLLACFVSESSGHDRLRVQNISYLVRTGTREDADLQALECSHSVLSTQCSVLDVCAVPVETWLAWGAAGGVDVTGVD